MCLGIPAKITAISDHERGIAIAETQGVSREVSVAMLALGDTALCALPGNWVLLHVGFAMAVIDETEAQRMLSLLEEIGDDGI